MSNKKYNVAIIGAGSIGIACAYYIKQLKPELSIALIDRGAPMHLTSSVSGENYRNWWPHPIMKAFMDRSITLLEDLDAKTLGTVINSRNGYVLVTRENADEQIQMLRDTFDSDAIRDHESAGSYTTALDTCQNGVDIIRSAQAIQTAYPTFEDQAATLLHVRRGGCISTHDLGLHMLKAYRQSGGDLLRADVQEIDHRQDFDIKLNSEEGPVSIEAEVVVNAGGPFADKVSLMLDVTLPVYHTLQQKIAFADTVQTIPRDLPFTIDLDPQQINWTAEEREAITEDEQLAFLGDLMPGSIHCRPDGGPGVNRIKLGWAYNQAPAEAHMDGPLDNHFPEVVLRGASRLHPGLAAYANGFPRDFIHYGGYYTMTEENWPLIGPTALPGYFVAAAMSGFGSMAACASGELLAQHVTDSVLPGYAAALSIQRYQDRDLIEEINRLQSRGIL